MTKNKKLLITIACLTVILCSLITGTIAWLTDETTSIKNEFLPSNIGIELKESDDLDLKMVPGTTITKDPKVTVKADSEDCYVFVKVEKSENFDSFMAYEMADGWETLTGETGVYYKAVSTSNADQVFPVLKGNTVAVKSDVTKAMMNALVPDDPNTTDVNESTYPTLTFTAYACQQANGTDAGFTPEAAWAEAQNAPVSGN